MIKNNYNSSEAKSYIDQAGKDVADQELALRVYTSRIIGQNPDLVMHGGGNTSVKVERKDLFGNTKQVIHVKGSGWDLDTIQAPGLPGLWLDSLRELRNLDKLSDEDMVNAQRANLLDSSAPNPSVETLLHAFLPHKFVDHTHATPFLILANLPNAEEVCRKIFGSRLGIVPYIMPGFALAKKAAEVYEEDPSVEGLILLGHGHFAFGQTAEKSYNQIISHTQTVADYFNLENPTSLNVKASHSSHEVLPVIRGLIADMIGPTAAMPIIDVRNGPEEIKFLNRNDLDSLSERGTASPDHVIRIKGRPLVLRKSVWEQGRSAIKEALKDYEVEYKAMFERQAPKAAQPKTILPSDPKTIWMEGVGLLGLGANFKSASIAGDLVVQNALVRSVGEDAGGFYPIGEKDLFDCEYWPLEQAKLGKGKAPPFQGKVVMVTGGSGTIGFEIAKAFSSLGAQCFLVDINQENLDIATEKLGPGHFGKSLDVTDPDAASEAIKSVIEAYGGLDILVSNAGSAKSGAMVDMPGSSVRKAFELNFFSHYEFAKEAANLLKLQSRGG